MLPPELPEVSVKRYSTPEASLPVVAVMLMDEAPPAAGAEANDAGFGDGGVVSGVADVVALEVFDALPVLPWLSRMVIV